MEYKESLEASKQHKEIYLSGINALIEKRQKESHAKRDEFSKDILDNPQKYREELKAILGWPLTENVADKPALCTSETLYEKDGLCAYRMSFEILDGIKLCGIFIKKDDKKRPLVITQHGALGSPECICGFYETTGNYNDFAERILNRDVNIFAPQLLLWDENQYDVKYSRSVIDAKLKRVGSSIAAVELYGLMRIIDWFEKQSYVGSIGMAGLSYGGYYTMLLSAIEPRIKSAISCSFFCGGDVLREFCDIHYFDLGNKMSWAEIVSLVYPRRMYLAIGDEDFSFPFTESQKEFDRLKKICSPVGTDWVEFEVFHGDHEFIKDDAFIEKMTADLM